MSHDSQHVTLAAIRAAAAAPAPPAHALFDDVRRAQEQARAVAERIPNRAARRALARSQRRRR